MTQLSLKISYQTIRYEIFYASSSTFLPLSPFAEIKTPSLITTFAFEYGCSGEIPQFLKDP